MDYNNDFWIGFLCEQIIRQCVQMSIIKCPGCDEKLFSPVLHLHHQLSLFDKINHYFEEVRGSILPAVDVYYTQFEEILPHSNDRKKDRIIYNNTATNFLIQAKPETIYYGRYVNSLNDQYINNGFKVKKSLLKSYT